MNDTNKLHRRIAVKTAFASGGIIHKIGAFHSNF
ncbi:MAG: hypothetical protein RLZZ44_474 [Bacteroidota bacterium]